MIDTTDLQEIEISLPGDWRRMDNSDLYSFTVDKMEIKDERLFRQAVIRHSGAPDVTQYALTIKGDYCGIILGDTEFIIKSFTKKEGGELEMVWDDGKGAFITFKSPAG